jgi:hypothetical protein
MLAATIDARGRRVELSEERWRHIVQQHPRMARYIRSVMAAVRDADRILPGDVATEEFFYLEGEGPARWLKVVVHYEGGNGRIVTAFPRSSVP